jgi:carboxylesterase
VYEAWQVLQNSHPRTFAIGLSLGGALSLYLAAKVPPSGVVAMATPLELNRRLLWLARVLKYVLPYRKKGPSNIRDRKALAARVAYDHQPTRSAEQALLFLRRLWTELPNVRAPVLLMHSRHDQSVDPSAMPRIYERLGTDDKRMVWLENSGHIVTEDYERQFVYQTIRSFVAG